MREILFRGKRVDNGEWVYGNLICNEDASFISEKMPYSFIGYCDECDRPFPTLYKVDPETVCQYTGLEDKNGKKIFEEDIVELQRNGETLEIGSVEYENFNCSCCYGVYGFIFTGNADIREYDMYVVTGNRFDNPELVEEL